MNPKANKNSGRSTNVARNSAQRVRCDVHGSDWDGLT